MDDLTTLAFAFATKYVDIFASFARYHRKVCGTRVGQSNGVSGAGIMSYEKNDSAIPFWFSFLYISHIQNFNSAPRYSTVTILGCARDTYVVISACIRTKRLNLALPGAIRKACDTGCQLPL